MKSFTHINKDHQIQMVNVSKKMATKRIAIAQCIILMTKQTLQLIQNNKIAKGEVLTTAKLAGIMAAKKTSDLIPLCHPLMINHIEIDYQFDTKHSHLLITSKCETHGPTGVEMEALTSVTICALTIYDMCKAVEKSMSISNVQLIYKSGGKSGIYKAKN
ncbi:MAG: cyclic pyranopterin monophosphate synthase MoaC [Alphaproteobacteria bacterium]|nr:cyclic pyranopterin monophosphate synthase MoaC [Alphaproteobacteria bacterium]